MPLESPSGVRGRFVTGLFAIAVLLAPGLSTAKAGGDGAHEEYKSAGAFVEETVYEGIGFAGVEFGYTAEQVEEIMGEADGGCEHSRRYRDSGMEVRLCDGKVTCFTFYKPFRGRLYTSGLAIGDTLEEVEQAYGQIVDEREVNELCDWMLDRVLLIRRGGPQCEGGAVAKLYYYDAGLYVFFDEGYGVSGFGLNKKKDYIEQIDNE